MFLKSTVVKEGLSTLRTAEPGLLTVMNSHVDIQVASSSEGPVTMRTTVDSGPMNRSHMRIQQGLPSKGF